MVRLLPYLGSATLISISKLCFTRIVPIFNRELIYKTVLGLKKDPFSLEPDDRSYFAFHSFEQRLALLNRLVQGLDFLVLVIGERGSGKTTLLKRFLSASDYTWETGKIQTYPVAAESSSTHAYGGRKAHIQLDSEEPVVIVDDAHSLNREELIFLLREAIVPGCSQMIKRLILFGESELNNAITAIADAVIGETTINKIYMPRLTGEEASDYLQHRLLAAGYSGERLFSSSAVKKIHKLSGGLPGPMNENADQWLKDNYSGNAKHPGTSKRDETRSRRAFVWVLAGIAVVVLAAIWYNSQLKTSGTGGTSKKIFRAKIPVSPESTGRVFRAKIPIGQRAVEPIAKTEVTSSEDSIADDSTSIASQPEEEKPAEPAVPVEKVQTPTETAGIVDTPAIAKTEIEPLSREEETAEKIGPSDTEVQPLPEAKEPDVEIELPKEQVQPVPETGESVEKTVLAKESVQPVTVSESVVKEEVVDKPEKRSVRREDWILSQDSQHYTIQIMGVSTESSLPDFIEKNQLLEQNEIAYYRTTFRGKPWFQLLYGVYASEEEARRDAAKLPENLRKLTPWIRGISAVQRSIRAAQ